MSKIEELIQQLCPNGVEWKKIGDVCNTITDYTAAGSFANIAENVKYISEKEYAQLVRTTDLKSNFPILINSSMSTNTLLTIYGELTLSEKV